jgi:hypothetical protein
MARKRIRFQNLKSIAGAALLGIGVFTLFENLVQAAARLSELLGISAEVAGKFGVLITVGMAASHAVQAFLFDRHEFLRSLAWILLAFWPLLLVFAGTGLLRHRFTDGARDLQEGNPSVSKKSISRVDFGQTHSTRK